MPDIIERLRHFERDRKLLDDRYGAEVTHRAAREIGTLRSALATSQAEVGKLRTALVDVGERMYADRSLTRSKRIIEQALAAPNANYGPREGYCPECCRGCKQTCEHPDPKAT